MKRFRFIACILSSLFAFSLASIGQDQTVSRVAAKQADKKNDAERMEGATRFQQNCGRCHRPPESLSPRIAPAVLRHMRVRANLTAEDERLILKFMTQ